MPSFFTYGIVFRVALLYPLFIADLVLNFEVSDTTGDAMINICRHNYLPLSYKFFYYCIPIFFSKLLPTIAPRVRPVSRLGLKCIPPYKRLTEASAAACLNDVKSLVMPI